MKSHPTSTRLSLRLLAAACLLLPGLVAGQAIDRSRIAADPSVRTLGEDVNFGGGAGSIAGGGLMGQAQADDYGEARILVMKASWEPWLVGFDMGLNFTDNVALVPVGEKEDWFWQTGVRASYLPKIVGGLFGYVQASHYEYLYDEFDILDFGVTDLSAGLLYVVQPLMDTTFSARYRYYRISDGLSYGEQLFDTHAVVVGAQNSYSFSRGQRLVGMLQSQIGLSADRDEVGRHEHSFTVGHIGEWTSWLESNLLYRLGYYDYWNFGRDDWVQTANIGLTWKPTRTLAVTASVSFSHNESNYEVFNYDAWTSGVMLSATLKF
jgi:hypothetical protein